MSGIYCLLPCDATPVTEICDVIIRQLLLLAWRLVLFLILFAGLVLVGDVNPQNNDDCDYDHDGNNNREHMLVEKSFLREVCRRKLCLLALAHVRWRRRPRH